MDESEKSSEDLLSDLPDSLIFEILWWLPMRDVVKTTILSKRWENFWTTTPYLNFDRHASEFVNQALKLWKGHKVLKFKIGYRKSLDKSLVRDIDSWVGWAKDHGVEELYLDNLSILYSCWLLRGLSLKGCKLQIDGKVHWNRLRSSVDPSTKGVYVVDEHSINQIVNGSPQLEVLILDLCDCGENLNIRSSSLKKLSIKRSIKDLNEDPSTTPELRIWAPNLETLEFRGVPHGKCSLMDVSSLTHLTLDLHCDFGRCDDEKLQLLQMYGEMLWQIFPTIPAHVEKLTLSGWCFKVLGAMEDKHLLPPLSNFKFLTIINKFDGKYEEIVDFLQVFSELKALVFHSTFYFRIPLNDDDSFFHCERNLSESFLLQLRTVEITCNDGDVLMFPFIEILLKHASKLQKMAIRVIRIMKPPEMPCCLEPKVLRIPRSSPTAELVFL